MAKAIPAWQRLIREGVITDRSEAAAWILAGKVRTDEGPITSEGQLIKDAQTVHVRGLGDRYVSKGGLKLEGALRDFALSVEGRVCIDAGASTGGFTDCLVRCGAARVYAVDVGYGQLMGSLRANPTVVNLERTNIGDETLRTLDPRPTLGTVDLSYLSLRKAVPQFAEVMHHQGDLVCLVKPLFEIEDAQARRSGIIEETAYEPLLLDLAAHFDKEGYAVRGITHSAVTGNAGTLEFFLHLSMDGGPSAAADTLAQSAQAAVTAARALPAYHKL